MIAVRDSLKSRLVPMVAPSLAFDHIFVSLTLPGLNIVLGCTYIPPTSPLEFYAEHCTVVEELVSRFSDAQFFLLGDYNLTSATWQLDSECGMLVNCPPSYPAVHVCETFNYLSLLQVNLLPNSRGAFLDLLFTNNTEVSTSVSLDPLLSNSHNHNSFTFSIPLTNQIENLSQDYQYYDYAKSDFAAFKSFLDDIDWNSILSHPNIDNVVESFNTTLIQGIGQFSPSKYYRSSSYPKWFSKDLKKFTRDKKKAHQMYKYSKLESDYRRFSSLRSRCKSLSAECYREYMDRINGRIKSNPRYFWKFSAESRKCSGFPIHMYLENRSSTSPVETADLFSDSFSSVYCRSDLSAPEYPTVDAIDFNNISVSDQEVFKALVSLPPKFSSGPDRIPPFVLKKLASVICKPLASIFNLSLSSGIFPSSWKSSFIFPIFKSGDRSNVSNYRGVCIQSAVPKVLDQLISKKLSFACKQFMADQQHGFIVKRSTVTNLLSYQHDILQVFQSGSMVHSVYTDVAKAFDRVDSGFLVSKLKSYGLSVQFLRWLSNYLEGRTQRVKIGNHVSKPILVTSGVGQGSHIGPILFSLFFNDLPNHIHHSSFLMFADDVKIYKAVNDVQDCILLQEDIESFSDWLTRNGLQLSLHKCVVISFSRLARNVDFTYSIQSVPLKWVDEVKDLGIILDKKLSFVSHISNLTMRGFRLLGYVNRNSKGLSSHAFYLLFVALIRSLLEYGCVVWSPYYGVHSDSLERVQKKYCRYFSFRYPLNSLTLSPLADRREFADFSFLNKLIDGQVDCSKLLELIRFDCHRRLRGKNTFNVRLCRTNYTYNAPINRMMRAANSKII